VLLQRVSAFQGPSLGSTSDTFPQRDQQIRPRCKIHFLVLKPTRCTNFSKLFLEWNSTCFGQFLCPSLEVFHCTHSNGICHTACEQDQDGTAVPSWSCSQAVSKPVWHIPLLCVQWKTPGDWQRNCPKHVEFHSKNNFWEISASSWFYYRTLSRCTVT
jgi:hypothetical protein